MRLFMDWQGALRPFGGGGLSGPDSARLISPGRIDPQLRGGTPGGGDLFAAALELEPPQREQDDTHSEPAQQLERVGPILPAESVRLAADPDGPCTASRASRSESSPQLCLSCAVVIADGGY